MLSSRLQAIQLAQEMLTKRPVYLDTETTGTDRNSEIVEVCIVNEDGKVLYQSFVKPISPITADTTRIHGITNDMIRGAPNWLRVWPEVEAVIADRYIGIYNADFDLRMMQQTHAKYRLPWIANPVARNFCIMKMYAQFYGDWDPVRGSYRWQSLDSAGRQCHIPLRNTHRAFDDCLLAREILAYIAKQA